jgi:hypothetical protein
LTRAQKLIRALTLKFKNNCVEMMFGVLGGVAWRFEIALRSSLFALSFIAPADPSDLSVPPHDNDWIIFWEANKRPRNRRVLLSR